MSKVKVKQKEQEVYKLDFGCGPNTREGFEGVDVLDFGQKWRIDLYGTWPWPDESVEEAHCSHTIEHFDASGRVHFVNELFRVLKVGAKCTLISPMWSSCRAYGDMTHQWPPVSEFWFYYLLKDWRLSQAPHTDISKNPAGYTCDFDCTWGYSLHPQTAARNQETQQFALTFYKEAAQDIICTMVKRGPRSVSV